MSALLNECSLWTILIDVQTNSGHNEPATTVYTGFADDQNLAVRLGGTGHARWPGAAAIAGAAAACLLVGCSGPYKEGPVKHLCGQIINAPGPGMAYRVPWYEDLTSGRHPATIRLPASAAVNYQTSPWLQVSHDCMHGATVSDAPTGHVNIVDAVKTNDGRVAAIRLSANRPGTITVTAHRGSTHTDVLRVVIYPLTSPAPTS